MKDIIAVWHRHIDKQAKSSLTVQFYCDRHQLSPWMFYYWKRKLRSASAPSMFAELEIVNPEPNRGAIHVRFPSGGELWQDHDTDPSFLGAIAGC